MKKICILSLDGGGIRGIITCVILKYIEEHLQEFDHPHAKIGDYFDLIAGSSTGGLIASMLLFPHESGSCAKYSIQQAFELYTEKGESIFKSSLWEKITNPLGFFDEKLSEEALEKELLQFFGDLTLRDFIKPCLITSYDMETRKAKLFNTIEARSSKTENFFVRDICRATSAAPTYFEPARIKSFFGQWFTLIDGGIYANNPALCAYAEARKIPFGDFLKTNQKKNYPRLKDMIMISIGTGDVKKSYKYGDYKDAMKISWIEPIIGMLLSSNAETVNYQISQMYNTLSGKDKKNYYRLEPSLRDASAKMDDADKENIEHLIQAGLYYVDENKELLDEIAGKLILNRNTSIEL